MVGRRRFTAFRLGLVVLAVAVVAGDLAIIRGRSSESHVKANINAVAIAFHASSLIGVPRSFGVPKTGCVPAKDATFVCHVIFTTDGTYSIVKYTLRKVPTCGRLPAFDCIDVGSTHYRIDPWQGEYPPP